ncbi:nucleic acid/nucleotide deaminase domain-containing protein [Paenibacillus sp. 8b26]|uniref:nucleic acid/nucleotide deaminase domain-containing protein n=1 Tax=Paenibacillus sp. 8b26 TaxID=3424133 RepID=UPI003D6612F3
MHFSEEAEKSAAEKNGQTYIVHRVYTEREPCNLGGHECKELLANELPDSEVTYSVEYRNKASRDRGVRAWILIFERSRIL